MPDIADNLTLVRRKIAMAAAQAGRRENSVKLVAVSKGKSQEAVKLALAAGQRHFGENRVQEAKAKFAALRQEYGDLELHMIGPLQTNKAEEAIKLFDAIQTLDRPKLAETLAAAVKKTGRAPAIYVEVNSGGEAQKAGIAPGDLGGFLELCRARYALNIAGLMCIPPQHEDPSAHFSRLAELAAQFGLTRLSMGMSADFEAAIACGATEVRIGTAIFGTRNQTVDSR
jgi:pyridoxal phosphate enzyme (YggS family)